MVDAATMERLRGIESRALAIRDARNRRALAPPRVSLWEAQTVGLELAGYVAGEYAGDVEWEVLEVGAATIELPAEHPLAQWAARWYERDKDVVVLRVDPPGREPWRNRWCGTMSECVTAQDETGDRVTRVTFLHDLEQLNHLPVWPNPVLPDVLQTPKVFQLYMKAQSLLTTTLLLSLLRQHGPVAGLNLPDDILSFESWAAQWDWRKWPMITHPGNYTDDATPLRYLGARMDHFLDVARPICEDVQMHIEIIRWFPGDPDPWPGARLTTPGQMVVRFVDKSGWFEGTSTEGTLGRGLLRTVLEVADGAVEEIRRVVDERPNAPEYEVSSWLGVAPQQPYVTYLTHGAANMVQSAEETYSPPTVGKVTVGGQSMPGVNETISAAVKVTFNILGSFIPGGAGFGSIVDDSISPIYENTVLAFWTWQLVLRRRRLGWGHYCEDTDVGNIPAFTIEAFMALRALRRASEGSEGMVIDVGDGLPYFIGEHWHIADRIGAQTLTNPDRIIALTCQKLRLAWSAEEPYSYSATLGRWPRRDPVLWAIGQVGQVAQDLQKRGLL